jgi:hypothetical protein
VQLTSWGVGADLWALTNQRILQITSYTPIRYTAEPLVYLWVAVTNALLLAELHGRQAAVLLLINQGLPLFWGSVLSHGGNLVLGNVRLL